MSQNVAGLGPKEAEFLTVSSHREERLTRWRRSLSSGIAALEPGRDGDTGRIVTRWRLRVNLDETWRLGESNP